MDCQAYRSRRGDSVHRTDRLERSPAVRSEGRSRASRHLGRYRNGDARLRETPVPARSDQRRKFRQSLSRRSAGISSPIPQAVCLTNGMRVNETRWCDPEAVKNSHLGRSGLSFHRGNAVFNVNRMSRRPAARTLPFAGAQVRQATRLGKKRSAVLASSRWHSTSKFITLPRLI